jgi:hypothetical protein
MNLVAIYTSSSFTADTISYELIDYVMSGAEISCCGISK